MKRGVDSQQMCKQNFDGQGVIVQPSMYYSYYCQGTISHVTMFSDGEQQQPAKRWWTCTKLSILSDSTFHLQL